MKPLPPRLLGEGRRLPVFLLLHYYQAGLSLGHFIKTSLVLLKNFKELMRLMENFLSSVSIVTHLQIPAN